MKDDMFPCQYPKGKAFNVILESRGQQTGQSASFMQSGWADGEHR